MDSCSQPLRPGQGQQWTPWQALIVNDPSFQAPSCGSASSWLVKKCKKRIPGMQLPVLLLLFGVAHTPFPLWRSYGCRGVCVGLPLIHRSSFTFWETWGWATNWHKAFLSMNVAHSIPQAFLCAAYRFLSPGPRSTMVELQREDSGSEWRWKMRSSDWRQN